MRVVANSREKSGGFDETETETETRRSASPVRPCVDACASRKGGSVDDAFAHVGTRRESRVFYPRPAKVDRFILYRFQTDYLINEDTSGCHHDVSRSHKNNIRVDFPLVRVGWALHVQVESKMELAFAREIGRATVDRARRRRRDGDEGFVMETLPRHAPTTPIRDVVERVIQRAKAELDSLIESAPGRSEHERRAELARYAHRTRQRLVRLAVVEKWATKSAKIATVATNAHLTLRAHEDAFVRIADGLFGLHQQLEWAKAPLWDLPGALDVMCNGNYSALSRAISEIGLKPRTGEEGEEEKETDEERERREAFEERYEAEMTERLVKSKTNGRESRDDHLQWPSESFKVMSISGGKVVVGEEGEYKATLTLGGPVAPGVTEQPRYGGWRVESIEILAGEPGKKFELNKAEERKLCDIACARMVGLAPFGQTLAEDAPALVPEHLVGLHRVARDAVLMLSANSVLAQSQKLKESAEKSTTSRWSRNAVKVEIVRGMAAGTLEGVRVTFWRDEDNAGLMEISFDNEQSKMHAKAKCPGENEFETLTFNSASIDVEGILLEAMRVASLKKFREMCEELKSDKTFKTSIENSMTAEECACQEDEDGWASDSRPAIKVEISKFTHLFVTCRVSDGSLALHGANELVPPATEAELSKRLALEGHSALASIVEEVSVAVGRQELKGLLRTSGTAVHPAPGTLGGKAWSSFDFVPNGALPTALVPVTPSDGGVFVAAWMGVTPIFAAVRAHRVSAAARYTVDEAETLSLGARKGSKADVVVKMIGDACRDLAPDAQRSALVQLLKDLRVPFVDIRPTASKKSTAENMVSFEIGNTARWARSVYKRAIKSKSALRVHVTLRGIDGVSARVGDETLNYDHSEFVAHAVMSDVRRIAAAQGLLSSLTDNDAGIDLAKSGCKLARQDAFNVAVTYEKNLACSVSWHDGGSLGPGLYVDSAKLNADAKRALSLAVRDGRCDVLLRALRAVTASSRLDAHLGADVQLTFAHPTVVSVVKIEGEDAMRLFSLSFKLDGSATAVIGRGGDASEAAVATDDDEMQITDDQDPVLPERPEGLTPYIDALTSALDSSVGAKPAHGEYIAIGAKDVDKVVDALGAAIKA